jgi:hypothetical protein
LWFEASPSKQFIRLHLQNNQSKKWTVGMAQVVEHLLCLESSSPSQKKKKKKEREKKKERKKERKKKSLEK